MKVIILAAGIGSRLGKPFPKPLIKLKNGKSILKIQIDNITKYFNVNDIFVVVGFKKELIMENFPYLIFVYNNRFDVTNTSKSLLLALKKTYPDDTIWLNGDVVFDHLIIKKVLGFSNNCMVVNQNSCGKEEVKYNLDKDGYINKVSKKINSPKGEALGINLVVKRDMKMLIKCLESCNDSDFFERGIELAIDRGVKFKPIFIGNLSCLEIDFKTDLDLANQYKWE